MKRVLTLSLCNILYFPGLADITLPGVFSDNMVLQQESTVKIWGWGKPLEVIKLVAGWNNDTLQVTADNFSHWEIALTTPKAGGPYNIYLEGHNSISLKNVLIGEVWLCSGQSNMEWSANSGISDAENAVNSANFPNIRFLTVSHRSAEDPQIDLHSSGWSACSPESMADFSAVAYFFAKRLYEKTGVPIGLIDASWGGTPAEAWTPEYVFTEDEELAASASKLKPVPWGPGQPGSIYNAMIAPMINYNIAGVIWYQGESNTINASTYAETFAALIGSWRSLWGYGFPFYYAQIAPFNYGDNLDGAIVRDAQRRTLKLPSTGMVVLSDIGDTTDIHPKNKYDVGLRMANMALKHHYKELDTTVDSPLFSGFTKEKNKLILSFDHSEGLYAKSKNIGLFEIAGADGIYHRAKARVIGQQVVVQSKRVKNPVQVRFAWKNTAIPDLFNEANLPASCFSSEYQ